MAKKQNPHPKGTDSYYSWMEKNQPKKAKKAMVNPSGPNYASPSPVMTAKEERKYLRVGDREYRKEGRFDAKQNRQQAKLDKNKKKK